MVAIFTNKQTGQVELVDKAYEYGEMYNPALRKWYHVVKVIGKGEQLICFESNKWKVIIRNLIGKETKK